MDKKDDYYITFLKYARERMGAGDGTVDYSDMLDHVCSIHREVNEQSFKRTFLQAVVTVISQRREILEEDIEKKLPMVLSLDAYFHLLEHTELEQARESSTKALRVATSALRVAFGAMVITVAVAVDSFIAPLFYPTTVEIEGTQVTDFKQFIETQANP